MPLAPDLATEARRQLTVCNACRYCEGYCATFAALERRPLFTEGDIAYIANICHDCRGCYQACMYAPPHEFAVDIPTLLSAVRAQTYRSYAWPRRAAALFDRPAVSSAMGAVFGLVFLGAVALAAGPASRLVAADAAPGSFYRIIPFEVMVVAAGVLALYSLLAWTAGALRFARDAKVPLRSLADPREIWSVGREALTLRWMQGGGAGCYYPDEERASDGRRLLHALLVVGFLLANVSTALASLAQHYLEVLPPYPLTSAPVLFGIAGGIGMVVGTTGLLYLKVRASGRLISKDMLRMDWAFLLVFDLVSITGFLTLFFRETALMSVMLLIHLTMLAALFVTVPYGKFSHVIYRLVALFQNRRELRAEADSVPAKA